MSYAILRLGLLETARITVAGKQRGVRVISQRSVDALLTKLAAEQSADIAGEAERARAFAVGKGTKNWKKKEKLAA
jgi:hypothetical protein